MQIIDGGRCGQNPRPASVRVGGGSHGHTARGTTQHDTTFTPSQNNYSCDEVSMPFFFATM